MYLFEDINGIFYNFKIEFIKGFEFGYFELFIFYLFFVDIV